MKKYWDWFTKKFGNTVFHPQFFVLTEVDQAVDIAAKKASLKSSAIIVDFGAGDQGYKEKFEKDKIKYIPVDLEKPINKNISNYVVADITKKLPFKNNYADIVTVFQVLQYIGNPTKTCTEAFRILKKGGMVIATSPFMYPIHDEPYDRIRHSKQNLINVFKDSGFRKVKVTSNNSFVVFLTISINIYLIRTIYQLIEKGSLLKIVGISFLPISLIICMILNITVYLFESIIHQTSSEFPVTYTIEAIK